MLFNQPVSRRYSLSIRRPLYGCPHCHVDPNTLLNVKSQSHQHFWSKADESAMYVTRQPQASKTSKGKAEPPLCSFFSPMQIQPCRLLGGKSHPRVWDGYQETTILLSGKLAVRGCFGSSKACVQAQGLFTSLWLTFIPLFVSLPLL